MTDLLIENAKIVDEERIYEGNIGISNGVIESISTSSTSAGKKVNASGFFVIPGVIDPHSHLGQVFGFPSEIRSETRSAVTGGVTTFMTLLRENLIGGPYLEKNHEVEKIVAENAYCDVAFHLGIQVQSHVDELPRYLSELGVTSFKLRMAWLGSQRKKTGPNPVDDGLMLEAMQKIAGLGGGASVMVHCENPDIIAVAEERVEREGRTDLAAYTDSRPEIAELNAMVRAMNLAKWVRCPFYIPHVTIASGVNLVRDAKASGDPVIGETCPHYLTHTKDSPEQGLASVDPPLRTVRDSAALWEGINDGTISTVGTDHVPRLRKDKLDVFSPAKGFPGVCTMLPVLLSEGVNKGRISMNTLVRVSSTNSAKAFALYPRKGSIRVGADADLTIVDLRKGVKVTPELMNSASDFTIYEDWKLRGWPVKTIVRGEIIMDEGQVVGAPGSGRALRRGEAAERRVVF